MVKQMIDEIEHTTDYKLGNGTAQISFSCYVNTDPKSLMCYVDDFHVYVNIPKKCYDDDLDKAKALVKELEDKMGKFDYVFINTNFPQSWRGIELRKDVC